ncbi:M23 family metallopeptidase [Nocardia cyriacigeorgica]|uniref:M23 family metallopeptidase n=1 Tax=Nocardia cyriacigeorgica TaxID=135487 RepID=UPI002B4B749C|nr:M23 family metallopeptidase [Nocardia cyriacigeorgica]
MLEKAPRSPLDQDSAEEPGTDGNTAGGAGLDEQRHPESQRATADDKPRPGIRALRLPRWRRRAVAAAPVIEGDDSPGVGAGNETHSDRVDDDDVGADPVATDNAPAATADTDRAPGDEPHAHSVGDGDGHTNAPTTDTTPPEPPDTNQAPGNDLPADEPHAHSVGNGDGHAGVPATDNALTDALDGDDVPTDAADNGEPADQAPADAPDAGKRRTRAPNGLHEVTIAGGVVLASDWRTRGKAPRRDLRGVFASRMARARQLAARRPTSADVTALLAKRPTREDLRELAAKRPTGDEVRATLRKHRVLIGGVTVVALFAAADSSFTDLVSDRGPAPGQVQRIAVAYPWQMQTSTPSVRRYLDAVDHGERLREAAVVAAAARATLERARNEAAAAAAGERQPWMGTPPPPAITMTPGEVLPGGIAPGAGGFVLPAIGVFTSGFGQRWGTFHNGIDVAGPIGTPIYAVANGTVIDAGPAQGFGLWVRIRHDDGSISVYGHMYDFFVSLGERVPAGMQIARMGNRGDSTGPHLHFEVIVGGQHVDPQRWLALHGLTYS